MSLDFGHHLFRSRRSLGSAQGSPGDLAPPLADLSDRVFILRKGDLCAEAPEAPLLDWSTIERGEIAIQLKDTDGLSEGSVTIKASTLQRIHPALLPVPLEVEYLFPISLKTVVLQVQPELQQSVEGRAEQIGPDFDTPIAQVAREDEGYFKLAKVGEPAVTPNDGIPPAKQTVPVPVLTPADRPPSPMLHKRLAAEITEPRFPSHSSAVVPPSPRFASPEIESRSSEIAHSKIAPFAPNPRRRTGEERLREIFMTEDQLDAPQVANLVAAFPKVNSALVMLADGTVLGGNVPAGYDLETALKAPVIMRSVQEFARKLRFQETSAFTVLGDLPVTVFAEGNVCLLISHRGRGLLPGVRERIGEVVRALDAVVS